jgi:TonB family protein
MRQRLAAALLFRPIPGPRGLPVEQVIARKSPTISDPVDVMTTTAVLWADSLTLVAYDASTGRVLGRQVIRARTFDERVKDAEAQLAPQSARIPSSTGGTPYLEFQVEKVVAVAPGSLRPVYPEPLRASRAAATVTAQFVVDTTGHADMRTWKVLDSPNALFAAAAKEAVRQATFSPAEVGGHTVR